MDQGQTKQPKIDALIHLLTTLIKMPEEQDLLARTLKALDDKYALSQKMAREPGLEEIIKQLVGRIYRAFGSFAVLKGKRILDIACGSSTSKAPSFVFVNTPFGEGRIPIPATQGYTAQFEPWFCRILLELGADPVGSRPGQFRRGDLRALQSRFGTARSVSLST